MALAVCFNTMYWMDGWVRFIYVAPILKWWVYARGKVDMALGEHISRLLLDCWRLFVVYFVHSMCEHICALLKAHVWDVSDILNVLLNTFIEMLLQWKCHIDIKCFLTYVGKAPNMMTHILLHIKQYCINWDMSVWCLVSFWCGLIPSHLQDWVNHLHPPTKD